MSKATATATVGSPVDELPVPPGAQEVNGRLYLSDSRGALIPLDLVKAEDRIEDEMVRKVMGFAQALSDQITRFLGHTMEDVGSFNALLDQEYGATRGGPKGNASYTTFDGLMQLRVQRADVIEFGPQLQTAKKLIDEYLNELAADASPELQALITRAFNTDKEGQVNKAELYRLRRHHITDPRWVRAMEAITAAVRVIGSKEYVRFYGRATPDGKWEAITINLANA